MVKPNHGSLQMVCCNVLYALEDDPEIVTGTECCSSYADGCL